MAWIEVDSKKCRTAKDLKDFLNKVPDEMDICGEFTTSLINISIIQEAKLNGGKWSPIEGSEKGLEITNIEDD